MFGRALNLKCVCVCVCSLQLVPASKCVYACLHARPGVCVCVCVKKVDELDEA